MDRKRSESFSRVPRGFLYSSIAVIAGSLFGFVIAGVTVLIVLPENLLLKTVKATDAYQQVPTLFFSALRYLALTTVIALASLFIDTEKHTHVYMIYLTLWGVSISSFRVIRSVWVLENLIAITQKGREETP